MTRMERNNLFDEYKGYIDSALRANRRLIKALNISREDAYQDLAVCLLETLDKFDSAQSDSLEKHIAIRLKHRVLHMRDNKKLYGITYAPRKGFSVISLQSRVDVYGREIELPYHEELDCMWIENEIDSLPAAQKHAVNRLLSGKKVSGKNRYLIAARNKLRKTCDMKFMERDNQPLATVIAV